MTFRAACGSERYYVATDYFESPTLSGLLPEDLPGLGADGCGIVFHMLSGLAELGSVGLTAVGDSPADADATFRRAERVLLEEGAPPPEPPLPAV